MMGELDIGSIEGITRRAFKCLPVLRVRLNGTQEKYDPYRGSRRDISPSERFESRGKIATRNPHKTFHCTQGRQSKFAVKHFIATSLPVKYVKQFQFRRSENLVAFGFPVFGTPRK